MSAVAGLALLVSVGGAAGQAVEEVDEGIVLRRSDSLAPLPKAADAAKRPVFVRADEIRGRPDLEVEAIGNAELRRGDVRIRADRLSYDQARDLASASGGVRISRDGNIYSGPELQMYVERFEGFFLSPTYLFSINNAGGSATRMDFLGPNRAVATGGTFTSCPADGPGGPAWMLSTDSVTVDFETNEGVAKGAVLRFLGVPILAAPTMSFPLTDQRKSGWLPPTMGLDSSSGFVASVPYYWNIAPNRDATITPAILSRRGVGIGGEFRYIEPGYGGTVNLNLLPTDRQTNSARYGLTLLQDGLPIPDWDFQLRSLRVSDDSYWKDFPHSVDSLTPRLLSTDAQLRRSFAPSFGNGDWTVIAAVQTWQLQQGTDPAGLMAAPYERLPQIGLRTDQTLAGGFQAVFETEFNAFANPARLVEINRLTGQRFHAIGSLARPFFSPGWTLTPRVLFNAAAYSLDEPMSNGSKTGSRIIPTASLDSAWVLERDANWFGGAVRQTLEPRLLYVYTPYVNQSIYPVFDSAPKDFNFESIFTDNAFSGVDRVSDGNQLTAGLTTRLLDPMTGAETLRLSAVQRIRFSPQRVTPEGEVQSQRFSDVLLSGSTTLVPAWTLAAQVQYSPDVQGISRSIVSARYSPGPYRTVNATYRQAVGVGQSEQVELGWQWPIAGPTRDELKARTALGTTPSAGSCGGTWFTVGRVNYNLNESRVTDAVLGIEYDAGCWIGRMVAERLSTGRSEATTRVLFQLELVGLSRLGSSPVQVLKDNIPGYRMLRDDRGPTAPLLPYD